MFPILKEIPGIIRILKISHTLFALPFALSAFFLAEGSFPGPLLFLKVLAAIFCARSAGMLFNRIIDKDIDALNPRTKERDIPSGSVRVGTGWIFFILFSLGFFIQCFFINPLTFTLAFPAYFFSCFYSLTKRFTRFCHFFVGMVLAFSPICAFIAVKPTLEIPLEIWFLSSALLTWVAGFDMIYSTLDEPFDRENKLHSFPVSYGFQSTLNSALFLHLFTLLFLFLTGFFSPFLQWAYFIGMILVSFILMYVHRFARQGDSGSVNQAFFSLNVWVSLVTFLSISVDIFLC